MTEPLLGAMEIIGYRPLKGAADLEMRLHGWDVRINLFGPHFHYYNGSCALGDGTMFYDGNAKVLLNSTEDLVALNSLLAGAQIPTKEAIKSAKDGVFIDPSLKQQIPGQNKPRIVSIGVDAKGDNYTISLDQMATIYLEDSTGQKSCDHTRLWKYFDPIWNEDRKYDSPFGAFGLESFSFSVPRSVRDREKAKLLKEGLDYLATHYQMDDGIRTKLFSFMAEQTLVEMQAVQHNRDLFRSRLAIVSLALLGVAGLALCYFTGKDEGVKIGTRLERAKWEEAAKNTGPTGASYFDPASMGYSGPQLIVEPRDPAKPFLLIRGEQQLPDMKEFSGDSLLPKDVVPDFPGRFGVK